MKVMPLQTHRNVWGNSEMCISIYPLVFSKVCGANPSKEFRYSQAAYPASETERVSLI